MADVDWRAVCERAVAALAAAATGDGDAPAGLAAELAGSVAEPAIAAATLAGLFRSRMSAISREYFGSEWAPENEYSIWARLTNEARAWGYGGDAEIAPLRWLAEATGCWFNGQEILAFADWQPAYEQWAEQQVSLVRRMTPGALQPPAFPPGH